LGCTRKTWVFGSTYLREMGLKQDRTWTRLLFLPIFFAIYWWFFKVEFDKGAAKLWKIIKYVYSKLCGKKMKKILVQLAISPFFFVWIQLPENPISGVYLIHHYIKLYWIYWMLRFF
jgi:hypothetical protein